MTAAEIRSELNLIRIDDETLGFLTSRIRQGRQPIDRIANTFCRRGISIGQVHQIAALVD